MVVNRIVGLSAAVLLILSGCGEGANPGECGDETPGDAANCIDPTPSAGGVPGSDGLLIKAEPAKASERFGEAVVMDNTTLAISSPYDPTCGDTLDVADGCAESGSVYLYDISPGGAVSQSQVLRIQPPVYTDAIGSALDLEGDTLVVGAARSSRCPPWDLAASNCQSSGAVYVYERSGGVFTQAAELHASNFDDFDRFGSSVALLGDKLAIGAPGQGTCGDPDPDNIDPDQLDGPGCSESGAIYLFEKLGGVWIETAFLKSDRIYASGNLGSDVALSEDRIFGGAIGESRLFVYDWDGTRWVIGAALESSDIENASQLGWPNLGETLEFRDGDLYVGAGSFGGGGDVFILNEDSLGQWIVHQKLAGITSDWSGGRFGEALSLSPDGNKMIVSAPDDDLCGDPGQASGECSDAGALFVYERTGSTWAYIDSYRSTLANRDRQLGHDVAISDGLYVGTAPGRDGCASGVGADIDTSDCDDAGAAYLLSLP